MLQTIVPGTEMTQRDALLASQPNHPLLTPPDLDDYDRYLLWVFRQLDRDRTMSDYGPSLISMRSIIDYQNLFNDELSYDEIMLLEEIDVVFINKRAEIRKSLTQKS